MSDELRAEKTVRGAALQTGEQEPPRCITGRSTDEVEANDAEELEANDADPDVDSSAELGPPEPTPKPEPAATCSELPCSVPRAARSAPRPWVVQQVRPEISLTYTSAAFGDSDQCAFDAPGRGHHDRRGAGAIIDWPCEQGTVAAKWCCHDAQTFARPDVLRDRGRSDCARAPP